MNRTAKTQLSSTHTHLSAQKARSGRINLGQIGAYSILIIVAAIYLVPMLTVVNVSMKTLPEFMRNPTTLAQGFNLKNFVDAWNKANFPQYLTNTILYTAVATVIYVITAVFVAFPISRRYIKGSNFILTLYVIALFLPPALIPQFQLILQLGLYNTQPGYIMLFLANPIGILILVNYMKSIPKELDEAAAIDGCGYFRFVTQIVFPLIKPALATVMVLHAIGIWNELVLPTIYLTNKDYLPITRGLMVFYGQYGNNWPALSAAVLMLMLPMVILFLFLQRYFIEGALGGSLKG